MNNRIQMCGDYESEYLVAKREEGQKYLNCAPLKTLGKKTPNEERRS